jgi:hypothetical protein
MFRDARGVVHTVSSANPLEDLPPAAAMALQSALLTPLNGDVGSALERCDAVTDLVERWQDAFFASLPDAVDLAEEAAEAARAGMSLSEFETAYGDEDDDVPLDLAALGDADDLTELLLDEDDDDPRGLLPEDLVAVLERELLLLPLRTRLEALVAAADLVAQWSDLLSDPEKLVGHLVLAHGRTPEQVPHEARADHHAELHASTGLAHSALAD